MKAGNVSAFFNTQLYIANTFKWLVPLEQPATAVESLQAIFFPIKLQCMLRVSQQFLVRNIELLFCLPSFELPGKQIKGIYASCCCQGPVHSQQSKLDQNNMELNKPEPQLA